MLVQCVVLLIVFLSLPWRCLIDSLRALRCRVVVLCAIGLFVGASAPWCMDSASAGNMTCIAIHLIVYELED